MIKRFFRRTKSNNNKDIVHILSFIVVFLLLPSDSSLAEVNGIEKSDYFETYRTFSEGIYGGTLPRVELLAGVLSHTSWMKRRGPKGSGNEYFKELHAFFEPHKDHSAIEIAEKLTKIGFTYDAPPKFVLSLSALPDLEVKDSYSDYLVGRARGEKQLEKFRIALKELSEESGFIQFYQDHAKDYRKWVNQCTADFGAKKLTAWLESFFGWSGEEFHLVFAPAMFPSGGYAAYHTINGKFIAYQVIREYGTSTNAPYFGTSDSIEKLSLHELGHAFVNPSIEAYADLVADYGLIDYYKKVEKQMQKQAYGNLMTFLNESVLRAVTAIGYGDFADSKKVQNEWSNREKSRGFLLQDVLVDSLLEYRTNRSQYPTFRDYVPVLLRDIANARSEFL